MSAYTVFKIEMDGEKPFLIHVEMIAANDITFDMNIEAISKDCNVIIADICNVAPHIMNLDSDLQEAYDDAFRTQPKKEDYTAVHVFLSKYNRQIIDVRHLIEILRVI